ncbi:MAG: hypothetical protein GC164_14670 [Phycisphaera sp.]|nr:hypothetical protein [Phycisphaera sp.]
MKCMYVLRLSWRVTLWMMAVGYACGPAVGVTQGQEPATTAPTIQTPRGPLAIFPPDNAWNTDISRLPVHPKSNQWLSTIGLDKGLHPDFGPPWNGHPIGIPYALVPGDQTKITITHWTYPDETDRVAYPIPPDPPIELGPDAPLDSDRHILMIDYDHKKLYELYQAIKTPDGWTAGSGAVWDLTSNTLRPPRWTSADAAGLPIFPGLARYDEIVEKGELRHALRFSCRMTQRGYIHPATHFASRSRDENLPPMGMRVRLRADFDTTQAPPEVRVILEGLKKYGLMLADNGSDWFITGCPDNRWNADNLHWLNHVKGQDFEVVDTGPVYTDTHPEPQRQ